LNGTQIHGVIVRNLESHSDDRGAFTELYRRSWFPASPPMMQTNVSFSRAGVLRGMHYHRLQADYWCLLEGVALVGLYDLRSESPTSRSALSLRMDARQGLQGLYVPPGVAHGFAAITDVRMQYQVDAEFTGDDELGFAWDDPDLDIRWPIERPVLSERDRSNPSLASVLEHPPSIA
jgi:dTDP-4-dehydrorhamnose 3,5-epimerase